MVATSNAWNFIDGVNGLSSGIAFFVMLALSKLANDIGMLAHSNFLIILSFAVLGFWMVNVLTGKIFLGDAGSYTLGMIIAWFGIVISSKNESISSWSIFFLIIYVAYEFIFSVLRRILSKKSPFQADNLHLHSLVYRLLLKKLVFAKKTTINNLTGIVLMFMGQYLQF